MSVRESEAVVNLLKIQDCLATAHYYQMVNSDQGQDLSLYSKRNIKN